MTKNDFGHPKAWNALKTKFSSFIESCAGAIAWAKTGGGCGHVIKKKN